MKPGTVISKDNGMFVITEIDSGQISKIERLEDFVAKNVMIRYEGEIKTLKEIIEFHCDQYLSRNEIIETKYNPD